MTEFRIENLTIPSAEFTGVSSLQTISEELRLSFMQDVFEMHEDDELFVNFGMVDYGFPYKAHGAWEDAKAEAARRLNEMLTEETLEELLQTWSRNLTLPFCLTLWPLAASII